MIVVRGGALGDVLLGVPALLALRRHYGGRPLHLVAPLPQATLAVAAGAASAVIALDEPSLVPLFLEHRPLDRLPAPLRGADLAMVWLHGGEVIGANLARNGARRVLVARALPDQGSGIHAADWLRQTLAPLGIVPDRAWDGSPWLAVPEAARQWAAQWHAAQVGDGPYLVLHPGSGGARKNWPAPEWAKAVRDYQSLTRLALVIVAGPADEVPLAAFLAARQALGWRYARPDVVLQTPDLTRLGAVLQRATLYLGNDSGVTHLAAGLGAPTVAVFGASDPALWRPRGPRVRFVGGLDAWPVPADAVRAARELTTG